MTQPTTVPAATARRVYKGSHAFVLVTFADGRTVTLGGKRAERAQAALVVAWSASDELGVYGLRGDLAAARGEAHRLVHRTSRQTRSRFGGPSITVPLNCAREAHAIQVVE